MKQKIYQVDAFAEQIFSGNPAAVCPLKEWLSDELLQKIALENNLAETAFYVKRDEVFEIRWFTPSVEVDLCGHATLASAYVLFNFENYTENTIRFYSHRSGELIVTKTDDVINLNFPSDKFEQIEINQEHIDCFNEKPLEVYKGKTDYLLIFEKEEIIQNIVPNFQVIEKLKARGVIISAKGNAVDFVSRFFAPQSGITEDPVTGSAHTTLTPYWAKQLNKTELEAIQLSERRGFLKCKYLNDRVEISGKGKIYLIGELFLV